MKHRTRNVLRTNLLFAFYLISSAAFSQSCTFRTVPVPTQGVSNATGINDGGAIVGNFFVNARSEGFLLYRGKFTTFKFPGSDETTPHDINNHAQIVGDYLEANHAQHGFIVHSGGFTAINVPGQPRTVAMGVNDLGDVVGLDAAVDLEPDVAPARGDALPAVAPPTAALPVTPATPLAAREAANRRYSSQPR